ncbi:phospholipase A2 phaiodactylipin-like isoform X2 [Adelges cooleyi]|uniref:phospholipase A2 phaiodactylipin-like isoform X2 n=1 Tax=Adelges cooleyi TaxID=133065 RepID=UPI00217F6676|nr:phospholipase A2 phaiodactylipin-like isoform X2 [Adelges cooleyi]
MKITFVVFLFFIASPVLGTLIIVEKTKEKALEITHKYPNCRVHYGRDKVQRVMSITKPLLIYEPQSDQSIDLLSKVCETAFKGPSKNTGFIYPGTKWCGPGNIAKNYTDLGVYKEEDMCCRDHDHCTRILETGQCYFNLCNTSPYTRECIQRFEIIPNYHQQGRRSQRMTTDRLFNVFVNVASDFLRFAL